uniref:Uncharacterized protein n=1 Tax=Rangifer tarandus platyrhynchus TaxID=3082113 RepID=A0ACB0EDP3_RANTA|nr:unnamed protein product [Rangifer tarandus platyrhynchus]
MWLGPSRLYQLALGRTTEGKDLLEGFISCRSLKATQLGPVQRAKVRVAMETRCRMRLEKIAERCWDVLTVLTPALDRPHVHILTPVRAALLHLNRVSTCGVVDGHVD